MFDIIQETYKRKSDMTTARCRHASCLEADKVYVFGGLNSLYASRQSAEIYNIEEDTWTIIEDTIPYMLFRVY